MSSRGIRSLLLFLTMVSTASSQDSCTMIPVPDPASLFDQSVTSSPSLDQHVVTGFDDCMQICCDTDNCNVIVYTEPAADTNNCELYACHPTTTCSLQAQEGRQIFINKDSVEKEVTLNTTNSTPSVTTVNVDTTPVRNEAITTASPAPVTSEGTEASNENDSVTDPNKDGDGDTRHGTTASLPTSNQEPADANGTANESDAGTSDIEDATDNDSNTTSSAPIPVTPVGPSTNSGTNKAPETPMSTSPELTPSSVLEVTSTPSNLDKPIDKEDIINSTDVTDSVTLNNDSSQENSTNSTRSDIDSTDSNLDTTETSTNAPESEDNSTLSGENSTRSVNDSSTDLENSVTPSENTNDTSAPSNTNSTTAATPAVQQNLTLSPLNRDSESVTNLNTNSSDSEGTDLPTSSPSNIIPGNSSKIPEQISSNETDSSFSTTDRLLTETTTMSTTSPVLMSPATATSEYSTEIPVTDSMTGPAEVIETTEPLYEYYDLPPLDDFTTPMEDNNTYNDTSSQNAAADDETSEAMTVILICALTFGCVFMVAVSLVLGKRIYDGYKKRHYSRLDYLINGMYN